jgi:hypothetical protein
MPKNLPESPVFAPNIVVPTDGEAFNENVQDQFLSQINNRVLHTTDRVQVLEDTSIPNVEAKVLEDKDLLYSNSYWEALPGTASGVIGGGSPFLIGWNFKTQSTTFNGESPTYDSGSKKFDLPQLPSGFTLTQSIWEVRAEINFSNAGPVAINNGNIKIVREIGAGGSSGLESIADYSLTMQETDSKVVVASGPILITSVSFTTPLTTFYIETTWDYDALILGGSLSVVKKCAIQVP